MNKNARVKKGTLLYANGCIGAFSDEKKGKITYFGTPKKNEVCIYLGKSRIRRVPKVVHRRHYIITIRALCVLTPSFGRAWIIPKALSLRPYRVFKNEIV